MKIIRLPHLLPATPATATTTTDTAPAAANNAADLVNNAAVAAPATNVTNAASSPNAAPAPSIFFASSATASKKEDAVTRLRRRAIRYYLQRAKGPSAQRFSKEHQGEETDAKPYQSRISEMPRPANVPSLRFCRIYAAVSLALLLASVAFIAAYVMLPTFRVGIKSYEGIACSAAVVALLYSVVALIFAGYNLFQIHRGARRYADFITAMVDQDGNFIPGPDSEYAEYIKMFGAMVISQREYFNWFANGIPPHREIPASLLATTTV